ncbi:putative sugar phosphate/phosphate translocator [Dorcoceras hygrometricum]|uniref:Putative sugar phosphate/phosphate translocator n=1 Tax=Dorcoceras hygrometricum TaxID=472368 RepID=A0A2Z7B0F0_9LAMI|nr:putative sugar phosphate/phosphate translocator [Dorcoceras hygrometricum]
MLQSDERARGVEESGKGSLRSEEKGLGFGRDPSFSGWCDEDGATHPSQLENNNVNAQELDFDLPLVQKNMPENYILNGKSSHLNNSQRRMEHGGAVDDKSINGVVNKNDAYLPFDVESGDAIDRRYETSASDSYQMDYNGTSRTETKNPISVVDVLKTLFFILVWYTFSTILTLYNKTLLGDNMGKFPAPLLMNTVHFVMQAVLSNAITWFWSDRFHSSAMSWRDYFVRVVPTALSTALDVNLSNESLVFISVTFATMVGPSSSIILFLD